MTDLNTGKMCWRTCFSSISHSGLKLDILKSAIQKYARRRELAKMWWCVSEIYLFKALARTENEINAATGIITNLINRLKIILDEELLFADFARFITCRELLDEFDDCQRSNITLLLKVCKIITNGRLLRFASDVTAYWFRGVDKGLVAIPKTIIQDDPIIIKCMRNGDFKNGEESKICIQNFVRTLEREKNSECYYWAGRLLNSNEKGGLRFKRRDSIYMIWEILFEISKNNNYLTQCLDYKLTEFYIKTRKERHMWLINAIALVLNRDKIDWSHNQFDFDKNVSTEEVLNLFDKRENLIIDSYAIDMHCSAGRKKGLTQKHFAIEGAIIVNEDKEFIQQDWRDMYISEKTKNNNMITPESELKLIDIQNVDISQIKLCPQGCKGGNKVVCFKFDSLIWKEGRESMNYNRDYICVDKCKTIFGLREIGMDRIKTNWHLEKIDCNNKLWDNNYKIVPTKNNIIYVRMREIHNGNMLQHNKALLENNKYTKQLLCIALFRGIFKVTDFCLRNILIDNDGVLVSIDEHDIGKRKHIFGSREKHLIKLFNDSGIIKETLTEFISEKAAKLKVIKTQMKKYGFSDQEFSEIAFNFENIENTAKDEGLEW